MAAPVTHEEMIHGSCQEAHTAELHDVAKALGMNLSDGDVASYLELMTGAIDGYNLLAEMPNHLRW